MNRYVVCIWLLISNNARADIAQPKPSFEQELLPPPDLPPHIFPWSAVWIITAIVMLAVLFLYIKKRQIDQNTESLSSNTDLH